VTTLAYCSASIPVTSEAIESLISFAQTFYNLNIGILLQVHNDLFCRHKHVFAFLSKGVNISSILERVQKDAI
jgi:hypothetical protein